MRGGDFLPRNERKKAKYAKKDLIRKSGKLEGKEIFDLGFAKTRVSREGREGEIYMLVFFEHRRSISGP
jgi:hypothetical protein